MDGAYTPNKFGVGVVVRDRTGDVIPSMEVCLHGMLDASHTEGMAIWKGFNLARELLLSN